MNDPAPLKRDYPDRPIVGVGAVIVEGARALLIRRASEPLRGEWSVPGGVVELGETLRQATAREVLEETGLVVEVGEVLDVFDSIVPDDAGRTRYHFVLVDFLCRQTGGSLCAGSDVSEARWVNPEELESLEVRGSIRQVVQEGLAMTQSPLRI